MSVTVRADQRGESDILPADIAHHVSENGEGGNDLELVGGPGWRCRGDDERGKRGKEQAA